MPKVGVALALMLVVTGSVVGIVGFVQAAVAGSVSQIVMLTGRMALPVSTEAVMVPFAPTFTVATANTPVLAKFTIPSLFSVAANATMSGTGPVEAESNSVLSPTTPGAGKEFRQSKVNATSRGAKASVGVKAKTKVWATPAGISTGVLAVPVTALVVGSVVWKLKVAGKVVTGEIEQPVAVAVPALMMVAKAVAGVPTCTERLAGRTAETTAAAGGENFMVNAKSVEGRISQLPAK